MWLLDTNVWVCYLNAAPSMVKQRMHEQWRDSLCLCDIVKAELYFGAYKVTYNTREFSRIQGLRLTDWEL